MVQKKNKTTSYQRAIQDVKNLPHFHIGQEVKTKDGIGIIVELKMSWNGLYISPETSEAVVWYSTESAIKREEGGSWITFTYNLSELSNK